MAFSSPLKGICVKGLYFLPLGGSNEIGMNLNLYHCDGKWLVVDMGISFTDTLGTEIMTPDIRFLKDKRKDIVGIVLTHAHEDHIGALPYLWGELQCPMYATPFTAEVIRNKMRDTAFKNPALIEVPLSGKLSLRPFDIEFITLTHSIPEPNALAIRTPHGTIMHTGDWKIDPAPLVGEVTDAARLTAIGDEGVLALVCDSTNVFHDGTAGSEGTMRDNLMDVVEQYPKQRVTLACFASNVARMETAAVVAEKTGRTIVTVGRSLEKMEMAARYAGYLKGIPKFQNDSAIKNLSKEKTLILCTGSQGESKSALSRITHGAHPTIRLDAGDVVVFSARTIPGNERHVGLIQNKLTRAGAKIVTAAEEDIHVSGHPHRDDLKQMYSWVRPQTLIPVHGEARHLYEHRRFGLACGIPNSVIPNNGTLIRLAPGACEVVDMDVPTGKLVLDGKRLIDEQSLLLKQRHKLAINGLLMVSFTLNSAAKNANNKKAKKLAQPPHISVHGIVEPGAEVEQLKKELLKIIEGTLQENHPTLKSMEESLFQQLRRHCHNRFGKKPITEIHVTSL